MQLTLLPFNQKSSKHLSITCIDDISAGAIEACKDEKKPLCVVVDERGYTFMLKFGIGKRRKFARKEIKVLTHIKSFSHVEKLLWSCETETTTLLLKEYYFGLRPNIQTFKQLVQCGSDGEIRASLFQILFTLIHIRKSIPGFKHNDLKTDNIIVTEPGFKQSYALVHDGLRRVWQTTGCNTKIIDFESAHSYLFGKQDEEELCDDFGITEIDSEVFDVHLLLRDALTNCKRLSIYEPLRLFATSFIPEKFFNTANLTKQLRLKPQDQRLDLSIPAMLCHPYFAHLRGDAHESVSYEI